MLSETRERFVKAILQHVPVDRIAEVHFFPPIRQGGAESGVAVIAAEQESTERELVTAEQKPVTDEAITPEADAGEGDAPAPRYTVYTARYRLVLKGPERGKWDAAVVADADAPLVTVDAVVRGVQRRSGESDDLERMTGEELRAALAATAPR